MAECSFANCLVVDSNPVAVSWHLLLSCTLKPRILKFLLNRTLVGKIKFICYKISLTKILMFLEKTLTILSKIVYWNCTKNEEILNGKLHFLCSVKDKTILRITNIGHSVQINILWGVKNTYHRMRFVDESLFGNSHQKILLKTAI